MQNDCVVKARGFEKISVRLLRFIVTGQRRAKTIIAQAAWEIGIKHPRALKTLWFVR